MASGIGHLLREARHRKGVTLSDAAARTGVRETHLLAIERDELEAIGVEPAYVRGILRVYAEYLGLDAAAVLARYGTPPSAADGPGPDVREQRPRRPSRRHAGAVLGGVLVLATVVGATLAVLVLRRPQDQQAVPAARTTTAAITASEAQAAAPSDDGASASESGSESSTVLDIPAGPTPEGLTMKLEFTDTVWIRVLVDGENKLEGIMRPGAVTQFTGEEKIELRVGVADAVEFSLNGAWYGNIASDLDGPVDITCTPDTSCRVTRLG